MRTVKEEVLDSIKGLPDTSTLEDIQYLLYVRQKIQKGLQDVAEGRTVRHEEAERRVAERLKR